MHPLDLQQQHHTLLQRVAVGREKMHLCDGVIAEVDIDAAIKAAAMSIASNLRAADCLPALAQAVVVDAVRPKLLAALKADLIDQPEADLAAFLKLHGETLKNNFGISG